MASKSITDLIAAGSITVDDLIEVSQLSDTVLISAATISAGAAGNSFDDSGLGFLTAGFAVGDRVNVAGFTGNVVNNLFVGVVTVLTAGSMTIGGTDGDVIVDDAAGETVTITKWTTRRSTVGGAFAQTAGTEAFILACSDETTDLTVGTAKVTFRLPYAFTLSAVRASVNVAPTGAALSIDINEGGVSVLSTALTIDATEKTSVTAAVPAVISDSALADDAELTIDIDQVGSTIAGAGLKVTLIGSPA